MSYFLEEEDIEKICFEYAQAHLSHDEPIPSFKSKYKDKLESALAAPQRTLQGSLVHKTIPEQASVLFYEMIKQHPFVNGNKRIACVSLMTFLMLNNLWLETTWENLYKVAVAVASSETQNRQKTLAILISFLENTIVPK